MHDLLHFLANERPQDGHYHNWYLARISGSANNLLYRAISSTADLAIKFTIGDARRPATLQRLLSRLASTPLPPCPSAPCLALCRNDSNSLNFIRHPDNWLSVDWENSGWGDPAFEIADLICHPQYASVPDKRWRWVINLYGEMVGDATAVGRIHAYVPLMLVWWATRLARARYEVPRGLDERLVARPSNWQAQNQALYERYLRLATTALDGFG